MRFVQFLRKSSGATKCLGILSENGKTITSINPKVCNVNDTISLMSQNLDADQLEKAFDGGSCEDVNSNIILLPPITNPEKLIGVGLNYRDHCEEQNQPIPKYPIFFSKFSSCITGPYDDIIAHSISNNIDWEVELAVVIGKTARKVPKEKAFDYVFGYTVSQDITARDWQKHRNGGQYLISKSMDTFCPLGPTLVHKCLIRDPHNLNVSTKINGQEKQSSNTKNLIFTIDELIHRLTKSITLKPGDIILTGTPGGVGVFRKPQEFLKPGDVIETQIQDLGTMVNKIIPDTI